MTCLSNIDRGVNKNMVSPNVCTSTMDTRPLVWFWIILCRTVPSDSIGWNIYSKCILLLSVLKLSKTAHLALQLLKLNRIPILGQFLTRRAQTYLVGIVQLDQSFRGNYDFIILISFFVCITFIYFFLN